jgi:hypothetical protein
MYIKKSRESVWVTGAIISGILSAGVAGYIVFTAPDIYERIGWLAVILVGTFLVLWLFVTGIVSIWKKTGGTSWQWLILFIGVLLISVIGVLFFGPRAKGIKFAVFAPSPTLTVILASTPQPSPIPGVLYSDDFSNNQSGWRQSDDAGEQFQYSDGQYVISFPKDGLVHLTCANRKFTDAVLTVDSMFVSGDANYTWSWVVWRFIDVNNFYVLEFNGNGDFCVSRRLNGNYNALTINQLDSTSGELKQGQQWNNIAISSKDGSSSISLNGKFVASVQDSAFTSGDVCLGATAIGASTGKVAFDNLVIYAIGSWSLPK